MFIAYLAVIPVMVSKASRNKLLQQRDYSF